MNQFFTELKSLIGWKYVEVALWILIPGVLVTLGFWGFEQYREYRQTLAYDSSINEKLERDFLIARLENENITLDIQTLRNFGIEQLSASTYRINSYDPWNSDRAVRLKVPNTASTLPSAESSKVFYIDELGFLIKSLESEIEIKSGSDSKELIVTGEFYLSRGSSLSDSYKRLHAAAPEAFQGQSTVLGASEDFSTMAASDLMKLLALDSLNNGSSTLDGIERVCDTSMSQVRKSYESVLSQLMGMVPAASCATSQTIPIFDEFAKDLEIREMELGYPYHISNFQYGAGSYLFGETVLVADLGKENNVKSWVLPPGKWRRLLTGGETLDGGRSVTLSFNSFNELPLFIKEGSFVRINSLTGKQDLIGFMESDGKGELYRAQIGSMTRSFRMEKESGTLYLVDVITNSRYPMRLDPYGKGFGYIQLSEVL